MFGACCQFLHGITSHIIRVVQYRESLFHLNSAIAVNLRRSISCSVSNCTHLDTSEERSIDSHSMNDYQTHSYHSHSFNHLLNSRTTNIDSADVKVIDSVLSSNSNINMLLDQIVCYTPYGPNDHPRCQDECVTEKNNEAYRRYSLVAQLPNGGSDYYCLCYNKPTSYYCNKVCATIEHKRAPAKVAHFQDGKCFYISVKGKNRPCELR